MNKTKNQKTLCSTELKGGTGGYTKTQEKWGKCTMKLQKKKKKKKRTNHTIKLLMVSSIKYRNKTRCLQCVYANSAAWCV